MIKKILATSLVAVSLIFSGCGENSDGEDKLATQQMLDNGDFTGVIAKLESGANSTSDYLSLASAYMGKAGFSLSSIIGTVAASADSNDSSTFASYIESSKKNSNSRSLNDLATAVGYYQDVVQNRCLDTNATLSSAESDICLYVGLSKVSQTAVAIGYIAQDVTVLTDGNHKTDDKLTASTCAMQYAFDGSAINITDCNVSNQGRSVTFTDSNRTYEEVTFSVGSSSFDSLITSTKSTAITNGICTKDSFATRIADKNTSAYNSSYTYHVCPVNEIPSSPTTKDITTEETIVKALNEGTDSVGVAVSDDVKADIDKFKQDLIDSRSPADSNSTIVVADIIKYLTDRNK